MKKTKFNMILLWMFIIGVVASTNFVSAGDIISPISLKDRGGIIIPKDVFPEGNGNIIPIYVPLVTDGSNNLKEDDDWIIKKEITKTKLNFEWEKMIANLDTDSSSTPQGAVFSVIAGLIRAVNNAISITSYKVIVQQNSGGDFRAIIQMGDPDKISFMRYHAGEGEILAVPDFWMTRSVFSESLEQTFDLEPDDFPLKYYTITVKSDSSHKDDEYIEYLSISKDNKIVATPKIYLEDKLKLLRIYEFIIPYKKELIFDLTGDGFISLTESYIDSETSQSILETLNPLVIKPNEDKFNKGDVVEVYNTGASGLIVRGPNACDDKISGVVNRFDGNRGIILDGPSFCDSYNRWKIRWSDGIEGWSAEDWLVKKIITPSTNFNIGDRIRVNSNGVNVRTNPPELAVLGSVNNGAIGTIIDKSFYGTINGKSGFYHFWKVDYGNIVGWSAENYLDKVINLHTACSIELRGSGTSNPITQVNINNWFDIYVSNSNDIKEIGEVRISSDEEQDNIPAGSWTDWYNWDVSSSDWTGIWDSSRKVKTWSFATSGIKEVWLEVKDDSGQTAQCSADIYAISSSQCTSGPCCNLSTNTFISSEYKCGEDILKEYSCRWGNECGDNIGVRYGDVYCTGTSAECNGGVDWSSWMVAEDCSATRICKEGNPPSCSFDPTCIVLKDTGWKSPSATGKFQNLWTNPINAYTSDDNYTIAEGTYKNQDYYNFNFNIPFASVIKGIEIGVEGHGETYSSDNILVEIESTSVHGRWGVKNNGAGGWWELGDGLDKIEIGGGVNDLWGINWIPSDFSNENFLLRIKTWSNPSKIYVDNIQAKVYYTEVECSSNADCGADSWVGDAFCLDEGVYQNFRAYTCNNAGQANAYCSYADSSKLKEDCGISGYSGDNYCFEGDVYRDYINKGCSSSSCFIYSEKRKQIECGEDYCEDWSNNYCKENNVYHKRTCYDKGCSSADCFSLSSLQEEKVQDCQYGCVNSQCIIPTLISTCTNLQSMKNDLTAYYMLQNDINCYETKTWNNGKGFQPIGNLSNKFTGSFNGQNYKIKNLFINRPNEDNIGLFGAVDSISEIKSVGLENSYITGKNYAGSLIGNFVKGIVNEIYTKDANIQAYGNYIGGLIGKNDNGIVKNTFTTGTVSGKYYVGGESGFNNGTIENSYSTSDIKASGYSGGLIGYNFNNGIIKNSFSTGKAQDFINLNKGNIINSYGYNYTKCVYVNYGSSDCIIKNEKNYFYSKNNQPMTNWDFVNIWKETTNNFAILKNLCKSKTCSELGKECGTWNDGCEKMIDCGTCSSGTCKNGKCIQKCSDSDNGNNIYVKGRTTGYDTNGNLITKEDSCITLLSISRVIEHYCSTSGDEKIISVLVRCPTGYVCRDGECVL